MTELTEKENEIVNKLADVWNLFYLLDQMHPSDIAEFKVAIHTAQNIILSRPTMRQLAFTEEKSK